MLTFQNPVRLLVCGGRTFTDDRELDRVLSTIHRTRGISYLIQGEAPGADSLAKGWAHSMRIPVSDRDDFTANWELLGPRAGHRRNQLMLDEGKPDLGVAFPGGAGTRDMMQRMMSKIPFMWAKAHPIIANGVPVRPIYEWTLM